MPSDRTSRAHLIEEFERELSARAIRQRRLRRRIATAWIVGARILSGSKRCFDLALSGALLIVLSPVLVALYLWNRLAGGGLARTPRLGRWASPFLELSFTRGPFQRLPSLLNVWRGDMSFIGPRAVKPDEISPADRVAWKRFHVRPGLVCLWWIRMRANIAYGSEQMSDAEYVDTNSLLGDLGIALRTIPAALYDECAPLAPERIQLMGISIDNLTMAEAVEAMIAQAQGNSPSQVCFVNADCINIAFRDAAYTSVLAASEMVLADGIGVRLAGKILNRNIRQNVNGTDLLPELCAAAERAGLSFYLVGGRPGVAELVAEWMRTTYPRLRVGGWRDGYFRPDDVPAVLAGIRDSGAEILLVAMGAPKQEKWLREHLAESGATLGIGVGGLFDFYSGRIPRAPMWMREVGMEWFYRFLQEPSRMWRRYMVGNVVFLTRALRHGTRPAEWS